MSAEDLAAAEAGEKMDDAAQTTGTANGSGTDTAETSANGDDGTQPEEQIQQRRTEQPHRL